MADKLDSLDKKQISVRLAAKKQILEMHIYEKNKLEKEIAELNAKPHDIEPMPKQEQITDYKKMTVNDLQTRKSALNKELSRMMGMMSELKIKIVAIDRIIVEKIKK